MSYKMIENGSPLSLEELKQTFSEATRPEEKRDSLEFLVEQASDPAFNRDFYRLFVELEEIQKPCSKEATFRGIFHLVDAIIHDRVIFLEKAIENLKTGNRRDWLAVCAQEILNQINDDRFTRDILDREKLPDIMDWCQEILRKTGQ